MDIGPMNRIDFSVPASSPTAAEQDLSVVRQIVTAVRSLNRTELMGEDRELVFGRDGETQRPVIRVVERKTGEVIDQIPPEVVLQLAADWKLAQ